MEQACFGSTQKSSPVEGNKLGEVGCCSWLKKKRKLKQKVQDRKTKDEATLNSACFFYGFMFLTSFPNSIMEDAHIGSEETFHARAPFYCDPLFFSRFRDGERDKKRKIS